jgi:hypothetical protein
MGTDFSRYEDELRADPALVDRLVEIPRARQESERFLIRTDVANVDRAIARAMVLAVEGIRCRIEVVRCGADRSCRAVEDSRPKRLPASFAAKTQFRSGRGPKGWRPF